MEKLLKESRYILEEQSMLVILKTISLMDTELSIGKMVIDIMENGLKAKVTVLELKYGKMEENILENLKMIN